jgi:hypothetical protein
VYFHRIPDGISTKLVGRTGASSAAAIPATMTSAARVAFPYGLFGAFTHQCRPSEHSARKAPDPDPVRRKGATSRKEDESLSAEYTGE